MDLDVDSFTRFCGLLPEAMLLVAADATVLAGNAAAAALCRRTEAQLRGMPLSELLLEPVEVIQSYLHQCIAGGHLYRGELTLRAGADHGHRYPIEGVPLLPRPGGLPATAVLLIRTSSEKTQAAQSPRSHAGEAPSTTSIGLGISARADASAWRRLSSAPEALPASTLVDPTGCGDAFRAGLLYGIAHGWSVEKACKLGSLVGSIKIAERGGQNHNFTEPAIRARFAEVWGERW